jgi:hypothetical protein
LRDLTLGNNNIAVGVAALVNLVDAENNIAIGNLALLNCLSSDDNVAVGPGSLGNLTTGGRNTALGRLAGVARNTLNDCTFLGASSDAAINGLTNATALGAGAFVNASNKVRIGNIGVTVIEGQVAYTFPSDERLKRNIKQSPFGLEFISRIKPIVYEKQCGENSIEELGFSAQNVERVAHDLGLEFPGLSQSPSDGIYYLRYNDFIPALVKAIQEISEKLSTLEARI